MSGTQMTRCSRSDEQSFFGRNVDERKLIGVQKIAWRRSDAVVRHRARQSPARPSDRDGIVPSPSAGCCRRLLQGSIEEYSRSLLLLQTALKPKWDDDPRSPCAELTANKSPLAQQRDDSLHVVLHVLAMVGKVRVMPPRIRGKQVPPSSCAAAEVADASAAEIRRRVAGVTGARTRERMTCQSVRERGRLPVVLQEFCAATHPSTVAKSRTGAHHHQTTDESAPAGREQRQPVSCSAMQTRHPG